MKEENKKLRDIIKDMPMQRRSIVLVYGLWSMFHRAGVHNVSVPHPPAPHEDMYP